MPGTTQEQLTTSWCKILNVPTLASDDDVVAMGATSLQLLQLVAEASDILGRDIDIDVFLSLPNIETIMRMAPGIAEPPSSSIGHVNPHEAQLIPLLSAQIWYFRNVSEHEQWYTCFLFSTETELDIDTLKSAVQLAARRHSALRCVFPMGPSGRQALILSDPIENYFFSQDFSSCAPDHRPRMLEWYILSQNAYANIEAGPLFSVSYVKMDKAGNGRLFFQLHHLVGDSYSVSILVRDIMESYVSLSMGQLVQLKTPLSIADIALNADRRKSDWKRPVGFVERQSVSKLPVTGENVETKDVTRFNTSHQIVMTVDQTKTLGKFASQIGVNLLDILLWGISYTIGAWSVSNTVQIASIDSGRKPSSSGGLDTTRTVGWVCLLALHIFDLDTGPEAKDQIVAIAKQRENTPFNGVWYNELRGRGGSDFGFRSPHELPRSETIMFNFQGDLDQLFQCDRYGIEIAQEPTPKPVAVHNERLERFYIDARIIRSSLRLTWVYSKKTDDSAAIQALVSEVEGKLTSLRALSHA